MIWKFGESYLLFLKKADKIQNLIKHEYDQNVHIYTFRLTSTGLHENFLFIVSSEAKGTFSTPKND